MGFEEFLQRRKRGDVALRKLLLDVLANGVVRFRRDVGLVAGCIDRRHNGEQARAGIQLTGFGGSRGGRGGGQNQKRDGVSKQCCMPWNLPILPYAATRVSPASQAPPVYFNAII